MVIIKLPLTPVAVTLRPILFKKYRLLLFCYWNLNGLIVHNLNNFSVLQSYITKHDFDIVCLSETVLNSLFENDDYGQKINDHN